MKKIISYILIALILFAGSYALLTPNVTYAAENVIEAAPDLECWSWDKSIEWDGCFALIGYYGLYIPTAWVLIIAGAVFDAMLAFSLNSANLDQAFVLDAWKIVRNVANLFFIFILLYIAISTILQTAGDNLKKALINVIIVGLVINFSFFFTRIIIDASNIFAIEFYNKIGETSDSTHTSAAMPIVERSVSAGFVSAFNPQQIIASDTFEIWQKKGGYSKSVLLMMFIAGAVVNIFTAYVFFLSGFLLVARVLAFMFLIIASPIAFMAYIVPNKSSYASKWWGQLADQALMAPIFLFFLYVITTMIAPSDGSGSGFINSVFAGAEDITDIIINMILQTIVIVTALLMALNTAKKLSGKAGDLMSKYVSNPALKKIKGGSGFVATRTVGGLASKASNSPKMQAFSRKNPFMGSLATGALDKVGGKKYDKWTGEQIKKETARGARATKFTPEQEEKAKRIEATMKARVTDKEAQVKKIKEELDSAVLPESKKAIEEKLKGAEESLSSTKKLYESRKESALLQKRREEYAGNLGNGAISKIAGTDKINREAAKKIRKGDDGKGSKEEQLVEELKKGLEKKIKDDQKAKVESAEPKTKPGE